MCQSITTIRNIEDKKANVTIYLCEYHDNGVIYVTIYYGIFLQ